ncbi:hypothetical protein [Pyrobaculum sp.]|uniref:hypothetical protein n=1 Tax=Pyrobaculum sp. TaxID=2004705 RepID=UPI003D09DBF0
MENRKEYSKPVVYFEQQNVCIKERGGGWACVINGEAVHVDDIADAVRRIYPEAEKVEAASDMICVALNGKERCFSDVVVETNLRKLLELLEKKAVTVYTHGDWDSNVMALWALFKAAPDSKYIVVRDGYLGHVLAYDTADGLIFEARAETDDDIETGGGFDDVEVPTALTAAASRGTVYRAQAAGYIAYAVVT